MDMAEADEALEFMDVAVWMLEQARHKDEKNSTVNRALARVYEKCGEFNRAIALWDLVRTTDPGDLEAQHKAKDLAASETIARGNYSAKVEGGGAPAKDTSLERALERTEGSSAQDRIKREVTSIRARIDKDPSNPLAYLQLASVYRRADLPNDAVKVLSEALVPTGNSFEIASEIAELEIEPFRRNLAVLERKLAATPADEELRRLRVQLLREINSRELNLFRQKAERYPTDMGHRLELGIRLLRSGQSAAAICELQAARAIRPARQPAVLGHCFKSRKNWRWPKRNFEKLQALPANDENTRKKSSFAGWRSRRDPATNKAIEVGYELANIDFAYRDIGKFSTLAGEASAG